MRNWVVVGSDYWYMYQPQWLAYLAVMLIALAASTISLRKHGHRHPVLSLLPADIAGGFTVCAAVTVSTFLFDYVIKKHHWYALAEPIFWIALIILAGTAVFQVSYLNKALAHFDAGVVVPTHFVMFTFFSIVGPSILYHELSLEAKFILPAGAMLFFFFVGVGLTFVGVFLLSSGKRSNRRDSMSQRPSAASSALSSPRDGMGCALIGDQSTALSRSMPLLADFLEDTPAPTPIVKELHSGSYRWVHLHPNVFNSMPPNAIELPAPDSEWNTNPEVACRRTWDSSMAAASMAEARGAQGIMPRRARSRDHG